jgi:aspartate oxidase
LEYISKKYYAQRKRQNLAFSLRGCKKQLKNMAKKSFLEKKYSDLATSDEVESAVHRQTVRTDERVKGDSTSRIKAYLNRLREVFEIKDKALRERRIDILKNKLYHLFIIKPGEVPGAYFNLQKRIAWERGYGDVKINE